MSEGRSLPQSPEAERTVLGGLMLDPEKVVSTAEILRPEDFYREAHQKLFRLMCQMAEQGEPTEMLAVVERIAGAGMAEEMGGLAYVSSLPDNVPSTENLEYYARVVRERATSRRLVFGAREIADKAMEGKDDLPELLDFAESTIFAVTQERSAADWHALSEVVDQEFVRIQELSEAGGEVTGITTGFVDLDKMLAGLHPSDLIILAARPAMGKTALALNIGMQASLQADAGIAFFSLEMSRGQLATRLLVAQARVHAGKVRTGLLDKEHDWPRLTQAAEDLYRLPIYIDDTPGLSVTQMRSKCRRLKSLDPRLKLIVVDYIGLMGGDARLSREQQISASSRGLKAIAKELEVTVIALSQLNRGVEQRTEKRPVMSDLRESGAIEQDADIIMFIYRDEYYNPETTTDPGVAEIIIAKQRNGATGTVKLAFLGHFTRFENLARHHDEDGYL